MAVTTTYSLKFVKGLEFTQVTTFLSDPDITPMRDGGFALAVGVIDPDYGSFVSLDIFGRNANDIGGTNRIEGSSSAVSQLSNGHIAVLTTRSSNYIAINVKTATGGDVTLPDNMSVSNAVSPDVAGLAGGRFMVVGSALGANNIHVRTMNNNGTGVQNLTAGLASEASSVPSVAALDNGWAAVAWTRTVSGETEVWYAVYNSAGGVIKAPAEFDTFGTVNRNVSVAAKPGGFVIAYEDSGWSHRTDISLAQFSLNGTFQLLHNVSNPNVEDDNITDSAPYVTKFGNKHLAVAYTSNYFGDGDTTVSLIELATGGVLASRGVTGGQNASDDVITPVLASFADKNIAVFHRNATDSDIDGEHLVAQRNSTGDTAANTIDGDILVDVMFGAGGADILRGFGGNDRISGGDANDKLTGGSGADFLIGGPGIDWYIYTSIGDSLPTARDRVAGFTHLTDKIHLSYIDAKFGVAGNNIFGFRGTLAFTAEGQVRVVQSGANTLVEINTAGTSGAEMTIQLDAVTAAQLTATDFFF